MGVDIHITVGHNVTDVSLDTVMGVFRPLDDVFAKVAGYYSRWYQFKSASEAWRDVSEPGSQKPYLFRAPAGFTFSFGPQALSIYHVTRFHSFCTESHVTQMIRGFTKRVLTLLAGERAIYSPDCGIGDQIYDLVSEGRTFTDIEAYLLQLGAPASSFVELDARNAPQPKYYIDRFEDFYVETTSAP